MQGTIQIGGRIITFMRGNDNEDALEFGPSDNICYSIFEQGLGLPAMEPLTTTREHFMKILKKFIEDGEKGFS